MRYNGIFRCSGTQSLTQIFDRAVSVERFVNDGEVAGPSRHDEIMDIESYRRAEQQGKNSS